MYKDCTWELVSLSKQEKPTVVRSSKRVTSHYIKIYYTVVVVLLANLSDLILLVCPQTRNEYSVWIAHEKNGLFEGWLVCSLIED